MMRDLVLRRWYILLLLLFSHVRVHRLLKIAAIDLFATQGHRHRFMIYIIRKHYENYDQRFVLSLPLH